ncbi:MAG: hypothetical protein A2Y53_02140 [Chloroflexi bacterium RBG_16_47_49]|nr:MAG: hypothetical protein A2Y53_02140 [Chloroflexi bacterium RBG_16_47_49]
MLLPLVVVIIGSFNSAVSFPSPFKSFTLRWYEALLHHDEFLRSIWVSTEIAISAATIATLFGIPVSMLLVRKDIPGKDLINGFFMTPLIIPEIAAGLAILQMFSMFHIKSSLAGLIAVHVVFITPYIIRAVTSTLIFFDMSLEEAGMNLGAGRLRVFFLITLPLIKSGVSAGFILAFIISFINVGLSLFLSSPMFTTLPIRIFAHLESRLDPIIAAVGSIIILGVSIIVVFVDKFLKVRLIM